MRCTCETAAREARAKALEEARQAVRAMAKNAQDEAEKGGDSAVAWLEQERAYLRACAAIRALIQTEGAKP